MIGPVFVCPQLYWCLSLAEESDHMVKKLLHQDLSEAGCRTGRDIITREDNKPWWVRDSVNSTHIYVPWHFFGGWGFEDGDYDSCTEVPVNTLKSLLRDSTLTL